MLKYSRSFTRSVRLFYVWSNLFYGLFFADKLDIGNESLTNFLPTLRLQKPLQIVAEVKDAAPHIPWWMNLDGVSGFAEGGRRLADICWRVMLNRSDFPRNSVTDRTSRKSHSFSRAELFFFSSDSAKKEKEDDKNKNEREKEKNENGGGNEKRPAISVADLSLFFSPLGLPPNLFFPTHSFPKYDFLWFPFWGFLSRLLLYIYIFFFLLFSIGSQRQRPQQQQEGSESGACVLRWQRFSASSRGATSVVPVTWTYERNKKKAERGKKHRQRKAAGTKLAAESWSQHTHTHTGSNLGIEDLGSKNTMEGQPCGCRVPSTLRFALFVSASNVIDPHTRE